MAKETFSKKVNIKNRKASYEYEFLEKFVAGMVLMGTEIKSIRQSKVTLQDAYGFFKDGELWIKQLLITPYSKGTHYNHEADRERKLLLKKRELKKLEKQMETTGLTIVPIRLFINDKGFAKIEIALARGKKLYDKRQDIKAKDTKRELSRLKL